ncbi:MAG: hypothetical protein DMG99_01330 [Acidobacteria bacterium]|nr:MAG: hypothetical protein DMG99_01330 [Acidobacteriota bacterium]
MLGNPRSSTARSMALAVCCLAVCGCRVVAQNSEPSYKFTGQHRVSGTVVSKVDGHALGRVRVTLADTRDTQKVQVIVTAEDGRFVFPAVPAGKFSLSGMKRGFIPAAYDQHDQFSTAIVTGAGLDTEHLVLKLAPNGVIYGNVLDEVGEPVRSAKVTLYVDDHSEGVDKIREAQTVFTNDLGAYEMLSLRPRTYYLSATGKPWYAVSPPSDAGGAASGNQVKDTANVDRSLNVAYPVTYYPDVTDSESATPIPVKGGERLEVDIHLNPVPALRLRFHMIGDQEHGYASPLFEQHSFDGSTVINPTNMAMVSPGVMEVDGIPAGRYDVRLQGPNAGMQVSGVDITTEGQQLDTSTAEAFSTVKMNVQAAELGKPGTVAVGLRSHGGTGMRAARVDEKGEAEVQQVPPGEYEVVVFSRGRYYSISRISADGAKVTGRRVTITAGSTPSISVTALVGSVVVEGVAKRAGKPFAGAMVVLVPKDVEGNRDLFRRDQSDLDGTFSMRDVAPGSYTLVAIENGWDLDWSQPGVIAVYAKHGRTIQVTNTPGKPLRVDAPVDVISK